MTTHALFVAVYLLALIGVGALKARRVKTQEDFSLAGRGLSTFVLVGTLLATWIGTGSIFGNAQKTYQVGVAAFLLPVAGACGIVALYFLAARIRRFGQFTIQDILEARFGVAARVLGTITLLMAYLIIVSYQYRAGAAVVERLTDWSAAQSICCVAAFVIVYTALAGMYSVAYTDVANGILMTVGILIALPILYSAAGGYEGVSQSVDLSSDKLWGTFPPLKLLSLLLPAFLLMLGDANMYQRFFSARTEGSAKRAAGWMLGGVLLLELAIIATALLGLALVLQKQVTAPENPGHIIVQLAFDESILPTFLGAMLVATIVAVVVSTADSYLLSPASSLVRDVYQRFIDPDVSPRKTVRLARIVVVLIGLVALGLAFTSDEFFDVALFAYTLYGVGITPAMLAAFFWKRATTAGVLSSMASGVAVAGTWQFWLGGKLTDAGYAWADQVGEVLPALLVSVVVLVVVSLATPPPTAERADALG